MSDETLPMTPEGGERTISDLPTLQGIDTVVSNMSGSTGSASTELRGSGEERYGIGTELARGGMGAVLNAKDLNLRRDVAMKIVLKPEAAHQEQILRFVHEAQVTGQLEHPSIVPVYELGVDSEGKVYYTMKYIRGTNLGDILKGIRHGDAELRSAYPLSRLLNIFIKACDAIAFAHAREVIHRDLKPDNIMVGDFGEVLVVDWGLAKVLGDGGFDGTVESERGFVQSIRDGDSGGAMNTMEGAVMGTPAYMAPEQAGGDLNRMGAAADIYAMGAVLHSILTLEPPFTGKDIQEILQKVLTGDFVPPDQHPGESPHCRDGKIPGPLSSVAQKAMALDPADRYPTVQELQADVQAYLDGFATSAEDAGLWRLVGLFVARHKALVSAGGASLLVVTAAVAVAFGINLKTRLAAEQSRQDAERALRSFEEEQARGLVIQKTAAPSMVRAARVMIEKKDLESARVQVELARDYDPSLAEAHLLAAQLFIVQGDDASARPALDEYLKLKPDDEQAAALATWCEPSQAPSEDPRKRALAIAEIFGMQNVWQLAYHLDLNEEDKFDLYGRRLKSVWEKWSQHKNLKRLPDGLLRVGIPDGTADLSPLKNLPIGEISLFNQKQLSDLSPLQGMPLRQLDLRGSNVADLSPLAGAPLTHLDAQGAKIGDLSPLAGMPLTFLDLSGCLKVSDLSPLAGMPLEQLIITNTAVQNLSPLKGMPMTFLNARSCNQLTDISGLAGMPITTLYLGSAKLQDLSPLASCTSLTSLNLIDNKLAKDLSPLRGLPLKYLYLSSLDSLDALEGMPLKELSVKEGKLKDLSLLKGMPLATLTLWKLDQLKDLSPLKGLPLRTLRIEYSAQSLTDISPLEGLPLRSLELTAACKIEDLSVIATLKSLEELTVPRQFKTIDFLDELPNLKLVGIDKGFTGTPDEFREFQAKQLRKKAAETKP